MYTEIQKCRGCGGQAFADVINLGNQFVVDFPRTADSSLLRAPLHLIRCTTCHLVQLSHSVTPDKLYRKFWYRSGINEAMRRSLRDVVVSAVGSITEVKRGDSVLDIGCNDGTMLSDYPSWLRKVGIDPATELVKEAADKKRVDIAINDYFSYEKVAPFGPYRIITAIAMFYDLEDPLKFLMECKELLRHEGVLIIQMNYLKGMIEQMAVDNICHEHLTYFTVSTLNEIVERAGLELQGVEEVAVNGGSIRAYITKPGIGLAGFNIEKQVGLHAQAQGLMLQEETMGMRSDEPYVQFAKKAHVTFDVLERYLTDLTEQGEKIYVYGASTRGSTLMQCLNLEGIAIKGAAERDEKKWGLMTVGTWIPILSEDECRKDATAFFCLPWHFKEAIMLRESPWIQNGGQFIFPLPVPTIVTAEGETQMLLPLASGGVL